ncbi:hypothetical protein SAMN04488109_1534 [Chryseolinea serpens]|uniref:Uncharacterized protein n=1 Tax=Chryseolinea serpens TaxID=947013 RepID=A0A1M5M359_9BACT|nr:hypothetical protein [Chryseolinea serpens]SHG71691.1 hypothetical protein SAMN04488109_1534 [Chryseolinea serpens]
MKQQGEIKFKKRVKASNVVLLVLVLISFVLIGLTTATINLKFKNSDYHYSSHDKLKYERVPLKEAKVISLSNLSNCRIIASDSLRLEVAREYASALGVVPSNDTLHLRFPACCPGNKKANQLILYLPSGAVVVSDSSNIDLNGGYDFLKRPSFSFFLHKSHLASTAAGYHTFFETLFVEGSGNSSLVISERVHVINLDLSNVYDATLQEGFGAQTFKTSFTTAAEVTLAKKNDVVTIGSPK